MKTAKEILKVLLFIIVILLTIFVVATQIAEACTNGDQKCSGSNGRGAPLECIEGEWEYRAPWTGDCKLNYELMCVENDGFASCWCGDDEEQISYSNYLLDSELDMEMFFISGVHTVYGTVAVSQSEDPDTGMTNLDELVCLKHVNVLIIEDTSTITSTEAYSTGALESVGTLIIQNTTNLDWVNFRSLIEISGDVLFDNNADLCAVDLNNLEEIGDDLTITECPEFVTAETDELISVNGSIYFDDTGFGSSFYDLELPALTEIGGDLIMTNNPDLDYCDICDVLDHVTSGPDSTTAYDNDPDACWVSSALDCS